MRKILFLIILLLTSISTKAGVAIEAKVDKYQMYIGEQAHLVISVISNKDANVVFPAFHPQQMIVDGVEYLNSSDIQTESINEDEIKYSKSYTITSFDGKLYYLPPFTVKVNGKEVKSTSLALKVLEVELDTTRMDFFYGPKDVQDNPFSWSEWGELFWLSFIMLVLVGLDYFLYIWIRDRKPIRIRIKIVKKLLPHQKAMKEIEAIREGKLTIAEDTKEYYTKLTDTLRKYIQERYGFNALEMTSSEIISRLVEADSNSLEELRNLFQTADLVKFAKYSTPINENDMNLVNAIDFINSTKVENQPMEEVVKPQLTEKEIQSNRTRLVLQILLTSVSLLCLTILIYVICNLYLLLY